MVFQSYALYPHKTVAENIGFPLKVRGLSPRAREPAIREAAAQVHMEEFLDRYPRQLSGVSASASRSPARSCGGHPSS